MGHRQKLRQAARAALALIALGLLLGTAAGLSGCATEFVPGESVPAPPGWVDFCKRNPGDVDCAPFHGAKKE